MNEDTTRRPLALAFTASGSEYFRIWIVNLLLIVVTFGFYMPFAKVRRLQYFYANTQLDGQALAFHGDPWRMLRGYMLMLVLFGGYALSGHFSAWAALGFFVLLAALWPALWRSSMRFRLHNTSWRGLRFGFAGTVVQAYQAMLPMFVPGLVFVAANAWYLSGVDKADPEAMAAAFTAQSPALIFGFVLMLVVFPYGLGLIKRYQHQGYRYADQHSRFSAGGGAFFKLGLAGVGMVIAGSFVVGVVAAGAIAAMAVLFESKSVVGGIAVGFIGTAMFVILLSLMGAYFSARLQNLCWNATGSENLAFSSQLKARRLVWLTVKNFLLTILSLGMYRPFAVVNTIALRLAAVQVLVDTDIDTWRAGVAARTDATSGEMAGDFFGIDVGL